MQPLELNDIQGIIVRGYGAHHAAAYVLLEVQDGAAARQWLGGVAGDVMDGVQRPSEPCINIAFTHEGLKEMGLSQTSLVVRFVSSL